MFTEIPGVALGSLHSLTHLEFDNHAITPYIDLNGFQGL